MTALKPRLRQALLLRLRQALLLLVFAAQPVCSRALESRDLDQQPANSMRSARKLNEEHTDLYFSSSLDVMLCRIRLRCCSSCAADKCTQVLEQRSSGMQTGELR